MFDESIETAQGWKGFYRSSGISTPTANVRQAWSFGWLVDPRRGKSGGAAVAETTGGLAGRNRSRRHHISELNSDDGT